MSTAGDSDPLAEAILPDGSIDVSKLPPEERAKFKLARDMFAYQALKPWPSDANDLRVMYLRLAGLGQQMVEVVLAVIERPEILPALLEVVRQKQETSEPSEASDGN